MATTARYEELRQKKNEIESTIKEFTDLLESQKGVGLKEPLVDSEGFPRADIDVYSCRHARHQIARLQNDHIAVMKEIEEELVKIHAAARQKQEEEAKKTQACGSSVDINRELSETTAMETERIPFAVIDRVDPGSPADRGGFAMGDLLLEFGSVMSENFENIQAIAAVLQHSKDKALNALVVRKGQEVKLTVIPSTWTGPGLLGCNIKPLKKNG